MSEPKITKEYLERAKKLALSYPRLLTQKEQLKRRYEASEAWLYTREEVIYKLSQGAHEQGERVKTSGISNPVERTVFNCDKVMDSMNRDVQMERSELILEPYKDVCQQIELFEISLRRMTGETRRVAEQLFVEQRNRECVQGEDGKYLLRGRLNTLCDRAIEEIARTMIWWDRKGAREHEEL